MPSRPYPQDAAILTEDPVPEHTGCNGTGVGAYRRTKDLRARIAGTDDQIETITVSDRIRDPGAGYG